MRWSPGSVSKFQVKEKIDRTQLPASCPGMPMINVVEPNNVVLAQIAADLHFDQLQRDFSRIGEAMDRTDRHIDGFIFVHQPHIVADRDLGDATHYDPVFRAMEVLLQRQPAAGMNADSLDLVPRA